MSNTESDYIELCKSLIEEKFSFSRSHKYSQKDLEQLSHYIEDEINVSISLSTLKRIWKNDFKQGPQLATLNALVSVLGYKNWQEFKLQNVLKSHAPLKTSSTAQSSQRKYLTNTLIGLGLITVIGLLISSLSKTNNTITIDQLVSFTADKTVLKSVPNTVIFNYDVSNVKADSFFIQQSWNAWRRKRIDPSKNVFSSVYFESGYHRAKLIANDSIIARLPVHILSDGWEPHLYYSESDSRYIDFHNESFTQDGRLHLPPTLLEKKGVDLSKDFYTRITNSRVFNISSNDFKYSTRYKLDPFSSSNCPWMILHIITEKHIFYTKLIRKGCEVYAAYKMGEVVRRGETFNLKGLGQNVDDWQDVDIIVKDKKATISINQEVLFVESFEEDFGQIMGLSFIFDGKGSIDHVYLSDLDEKNVFEDDFN